MATISVEVPEYVKKAIWTKKINYYILYKITEEENWTDIELEKPIEMNDFYNLLKKEL